MKATRVKKALAKRAPRQSLGEGTGANGPAAWAKWGPWATVLAALVIYVITLGGGFVLDDRTIVKNNLRIQDTARWGEIWTRDYWVKESDQPWTRRDLLYRPLTLQTYALNYLIGKQQSQQPSQQASKGPWRFHLVNVVLYGLLCFGIWHLAMRIFDDGLSATVGGLLFAVHPLHTEVVANIVGRSEMLSAAFMLAALLCWYGDIRRPRLHLMILGAMAAAAAVFSKETGLALLPTAVVLDWWWRRRMAGRQPAGRFWMRRLWRSYVLTAVVFGGYLVARYYACGQRLRIPPAGWVDNPLAVADLMGRILGPLKILAHYLYLFVLPAELCADYSYNSFPVPTSPVEPHVFAGAALVVVGLVSAWWSWRHKGEWLVLLGMFLFPYLLISNAMLLIGTILGERLFFWPSMPLCLLVGQLSAAAYRRIAAVPAERQVVSPRLLVFVGGAVAAGLSGRSVLRNMDWATDDNLTISSVEVHPDSSKIRVGYGGLLVRRGAMDDAHAQFEAAVQIYPDYHQAWLGVVYTGGQHLVRQAEQAAMAQVFHQKGQEATAADVSQGCRQWIKDLPEDQRRRIEESADLMAAFRQMYGTLQAGSELAYHELRSVLDEGQFIRVRLAQAFEAAQDRPGDPEALWQYVDVLVQFGKFKEALKDLGTCYRALGNREEVAIAYARALRAAGKPVEASAVLANWLRKDYRSWQAHMVLGELQSSGLADRKFLANALEHGKLAAQFAPNELMAQLAYARILVATGQQEAGIRQYEHALQMGSVNRLLRTVIAWRIKELRRQLG